MRRLGLALAPLIAAVLAHGLGVSGSFVADDVTDIVEHPVVNGAAPMTAVLEYNYMGEPLGQGANTLRPLATLLFAGQWALWGAEPGFFHLVSVLWFCALVAVVQRFYRRSLGEEMAAVGAALFASLAIHVDAVGLVANSAEVMSLLLALLALLAALDRRAMVSVGLYVAALLCKESAFLLPLVAAVWMIGTRGLASLRWQRHGCTLAMLLAAALAFLLVRSALLPINIAGYILPADNPLLDASVIERLWMPFVLLGRYVALTLVPVGLSFDYTFDAIPVAADFSEPYGWLGVALAAAVLALVWLRMRRGQAAGHALKHLAGASLAFVASYALFSNSILLIVTLFAERLFLAPSVFLVLGLCHAAGAGVQRWPSIRPLLIVLAVAGIALQCMAAMSRTAEVGNERALFAAQVISQPNSIKGHIYRARSLAAHRRYTLAVWHLGVASAGRQRFPRRFVAPTGDGLAPIPRLEQLPGLLAPDVEAWQFWRAFRGFAVHNLGAGAGAAIDAVAAPDESRQPLTLPVVRPPTK